MRIRLTSPSLVLPAGIVWVAAVAFGSVRMLNYGLMPGAAGTPLCDWPAGSGIRPEGRSATLVMVAHPHCPCTRASIAELARVMARAQRSAAAYVLFYRPGQFASGWERTDLWRSAAAIPGVNVLADPEGQEAQRFGAVTSGHVVLYDRAGQLLFTGGITGSRGHAGDNAGSDSVLRLLSVGPTTCTGGAAPGTGPPDAPSALPAPGARRQTFVYGCPIRVDRDGSGK